MSDSGSSADPAYDDLILDQAVELDDASVPGDNEVTLQAPESEKRRKKTENGAAKKSGDCIVDCSSADDEYI